MQNFSFLAALEVAEKFIVVVGGGFQVATMPNSNASCFRVALIWVELSYVDNKTLYVGSVF